MNESEYKQKRSGIRWWVFYTLIFAVILSFVAMFICCALHNWLTLGGFITSSMFGTALISMSWDVIEREKGHLW